MDEVALECWFHLAPGSADTAPAMARIEMVERIVVLLRRCCGREEGIYIVVQQVAKVAEILITSEIPSQIDKKLMVLCADDGNEKIAQNPTDSYTH